MNIFGTEYSASLIASLLPPRDASATLAAGASEGPRADRIIGTVVSIAVPGTPQTTSGSHSAAAIAHPLVGLPMPHSVGLNFMPLGLSGDAKEHWSKALSAVLRWEHKYSWADQASVLHGLKTSGRYGSLTDETLPEVLRGNRRFESRVLDGTPQLRAIEKVKGSSSRGSRWVLSLNIL